MQQLVRVAMLIWVSGLALHERLAQAGALLLLLLVPFLWRRTWPQVAPDVRGLCVTGAALIGWQLVSPFASALAYGPFHLDPGRYLQAIEQLTILALAIVGVVGLPMAQLAAAVLVGWSASAALAVYQHFNAWPYENPEALRLPASRVRENFATPEAPRYGGGGFFFHRLRFAHAAIALLGPTLAVAAQRLTPIRFRLLATALLVALFVGTSVTYARAALGIAIVVVAASSVFLFKGRLRLAAVLAGVLLAVGVLSLPGWSERAAKASKNLLRGERTIAMTAGWMIASEHPLVGVGYGNYPFHSRELVSVLRMPRNLVHDAHNLWLNTLAETGVVGVLLLLLFHALLARALWRRHREGDALASGALLSFLGFHLLGMVHYLPFHSSVVLAFYFVFGLALVPQSARRLRLAGGKA